MAYRVVADHIRTLCFAIADGSRPGNEGREYVLRRVLRRGVRYGREVLGGKEGFFASLVDTVVEVMGPVFPEVVRAQDTIKSVIAEEETSFSKTLLKGIERFKKFAIEAEAEAKRNGKKALISGPQAFLLWDTFGFPMDLTELMAEEHGLHVDKPGFEAAMAAAKELSRAGAKKNAAGGLKFEAEATGWLGSEGIDHTNDSFKYSKSEDVYTTVVAILSPRNGFVQSTVDVSPDDGSSDGPLVGLVVGSTSFYAEAGGQVADTGCIAGPNGVVFNVTDVRYAAGYVLHVGQFSSPDGGSFKVGDAVTTKVDYERRACIKPNHTFTHILNFALRRVLGDHVDQKGSIVLPERLRFDFSNPGPVTPEQLAEIEAICNEFLAQPKAVSATEVPLAQARDINGLRAVFGEVYPDPVRVVSVGREVSALLSSPTDPENMNFPIEFCGGTHLDNTSEAGTFALLTEEGIAKGIRRIVAVTGKEAATACHLADELDAKMTAAEGKPVSDENLGNELNILKQTVDEAVIPAVRKQSLRDRIQTVNKAVMEENKKKAAAKKFIAVEAAIAKADEAVEKGESFLITYIDVGLDAKALTEAVNAISKKHSALPVMMFSGGQEDGKVVAVAGVPKDMTDKITAKDWVSETLKPLEGKGGGQPTKAQGMGGKVEALAEAQSIAESFAKMKL